LLISFIDLTPTSKAHNSILKQVFHRLLFCKKSFFHGKFCINYATGLQQIDPSVQPSCLYSYPWGHIPSQIWPKHLLYWWQLHWWWPTVCA